MNFYYRLLSVALTALALSGLLRAQQCCTGSVSSYCTSGTSATGCSPSISGVGVPDSADGSGFDVVVSQVPAQRSGILFYGLRPTSVPQQWAPFSTSYLCVNTPVVRTGPQNSGGAFGNCSGQLHLDFNSFMAANPSALGAPYAAGQQICMQGWYRDPGAPGATNLSNALSFNLCSFAGDTTPPLIVACAANRTIGTGISGQGIVPDFTSNVITSDNCTSASVSQSPAVGSTAQVGVNLITITATDVAGNTSQCFATLTVQDTSAPIISSCAPGQVVAGNSSCQGLIPDFTAGVVVTDAGGGAVTVSQVPPAGSFTTVGAASTVITLTAADASGNTASCNTFLSVTLGASCVVPDGFVWVLPGTFQMGEPGVAEPVHSVSISYWYAMGIREVTQAQYRAIMGVNPSNFQGDLSRPVEQVSWTSARAYCAALTTQQSALGSLPSGYEYRLPTEAEWEYACRAGTTTSWNISGGLNCGRANFAFFSPYWPYYCVGATMAVGSYAPNAWGLYDMHGNVWEHCLDTYADYTSGAVTDPFVTVGYNRVIRGGAWESDGNNCRSARRGQYDPNGAGYNVGFRVVLAPVGRCPSDPVITVCASNRTVTAGSNCQATVPDFTVGVVASSTCPGGVTISQWPLAGSMVGVKQQALAVTITATDVSGNTSTCTASLTVLPGSCPLPSGFVAVVPGTFDMGEPGVVEPVRPVTISYWYGMSAKEVTQGEYLALMGANPSYFQGNLDRPVEQVSWMSARAYCAALTAQQAVLGTLPAGYEYRLPTEAEWEYACRAGTTTVWNVGNSLSCNHANHRSGNYCVGETVPVGNYAPNAWGLYDMHGNVWEYCLDTYADYTPGATTDPYVTVGYNRVIRGGGWPSYGGECRSSNRGQYDPNGLSHHVGFRVVLAPVGRCPSDPVITVCASNQTVTAGSNCQATVPDFTAGVMTSTTCPGPVTISQWPLAGTQVGVGQQAHVVTITATDASGNTSSCDASLTVLKGSCPIPAGFVSMVPGTFEMGEPGVAEPTHPVTISYWYGMGAKEVTQAEYLALMGANPSHFQGDLNRPVERVSWHNARAYCAALTAQQAVLGTLPAGYEYRLPTEAEWEVCVPRWNDHDFQRGELAGLRQCELYFQCSLLALPALLRGEHGCRRQLRSECLGLARHARERVGALPRHVRGLHVWRSDGSVCDGGLQPSDPRRSLGV